MKMKTKYDTYKLALEKKIRYADKKKPNISGLVKKKRFNAKITKIESNLYYWFNYYCCIECSLK